MNSIESKNVDKNYCSSLMLEKLLRNRASLKTSETMQIEQIIDNTNSDEKIDKVFAGLIS